MSENPANKTIEDFFNNLKIQSKYYSVTHKQPIFLVGEKDLYLAVKRLIESN